MRSCCARTNRVLTILIASAYGALLSPSLLAVDCTSDYIELNRQARIDSFQSDYGGGATCDTVPGTLRIGGSDVVDLTPLSALTTIRDQFQIRETINLTSLEGLSALASVGGDQANAAGSVYIFNNAGLTSLSGLSGLESVGGTLNISNNPTLTSLDGMSSLISVHGLEIGNNDSLVDLSGISAVVSGSVPWSLAISGNGALSNLDSLSLLTNVGGGLAINHNYALTNLEGLSALTSVGGLDLRDNTALADINGLSALTDVGGTLQIIGNDKLTDLDGLSALTSVRTLRIKTNPELADIGGLSSLESVQTLYVEDNAVLPNLDGLSALTDVDWHLEITGNPALTDLNGLSALQSVLRLYVEDNNALIDCRGLVTLVDPIDDYEPGPGMKSSGIPDVGQSTVIRNNGDGCNSVLDILGSVPLYELNAGLNDAWFNVGTDGQGFLITVFPNIKKIFLAWFTYDLERPAIGVTAVLGGPGQRWLTAQGDYTDDFADLTLYVTAGGIFDSEEPMTVTESYGELMIEFDTCNSGRVVYSIPSIFEQGEVTIERITLDNVSLCYLLDNQTLESLPAN